MTEQEKQIAAILGTEALEMAKEWVDRFANNNDTAEHALTILGHAVELFLGMPFEHKGKAFDSVSRDFRDYLGVVHDEVKRTFPKIWKKEIVN